MIWVILSDLSSEVTTPNVLLAYYEKFSRKKDKRKINFKHCLLRVDEVEFILPAMKGDFTWVAGSRNYPDN